MMDGLNCLCVVYDCNGVISASVVGSPDYCSEVLRRSFDERYVPHKYFELIRDGKVFFTSVQKIVDDVPVECSFDFELSKKSISFLYFINASVFELYDFVYPSWRKDSVFQELLSQEESQEQFKEAVSHG